ncbi:hypothetical protein EVAR_96393_1 [Eumeta japonica]|uniref:Uncharacterized protein n=1 Tax=Eumeta variegata TaxID=151549 RepID=A0A4C1WE04_EUMVA|nr:hypothetical protein EVAR_96393_1 [Eumeta japonica]
MLFTIGVANVTTVCLFSVRLNARAESSPGGRAPKSARRAARSPEEANRRKALKNFEEANNRIKLNQTAALLRRAGALRRTADADAGAHLGGVLQISLGALGTASGVGQLDDPGQTTLAGTVLLKTNTTPTSLLPSEFSGTDDAPAHHRLDIFSVDESNTTTLNDRRALFTIPIGFD